MKATTTTNFYEKYRRIEIQGLPKYVQLREIILRAIEDGYWQKGSKLPAEAEITRITPFSLGTVQKALNALVDEGLLFRKQGLGTFVAENRRKMDRPWHCRFASDDEDSFLPVYPKVVFRKRIKSSSSWAQLLCPEGGHIIQIDRIMRIGDEFSVYCKFFLSEAKFPGFMKKTREELERFNFKTLIRRDYNLPITHMSYTLQVKPLPVGVCKAIEVEKGAIGLIYEIIASSGRKNPVYYQELFIPPNTRRLHISDTSNIPEYWRK